MKRLFILLAFIPPLVLYGQNITRFEYFIDQDPGYGQGQQVTFTPQPEVTLNFDILLTGLAPGVHHIYLRAENEVLRWGIVYNDFFIVMGPPPADITGLEYFIDQDPGYGLGVPLTVTPGKEVSLAFSLPVNSLQPGFHTACIRARDIAGKWCLTQREEFFVLRPSPADITAMEYFFDDDPGYGSGIQVTVTPGQDISKVFDLDVSGLAPGLHSAYVRAKNSFGRWSICQRDLFVVTPPPPDDIIRLEYFVNDDPGFGNGTPIPIIPGQNISEVFSLGPVTGGMYYIYVRAMNDEGRWSIVAREQYLVLDIKVLLQGPYNPLTNLMKTQLNTSGFIPLSQPFNSNPYAVWYYTGTESVPAIPNAGVVDWVLLQLRDASQPDLASVATAVATCPAFLLKNGKVVDLDGSSLLYFDDAEILQNLYLVIFHRNHLGIMTSGAVPLGGPDAGTWDFSTASDRVYGGSLGYNQLEPGIWGMVSGDGNGNGQVSNDDKVDVWLPQSGSAGYKAGDFSLDGQVNNIDKVDYWRPNSGKSSQVPG